VKRSSGFTLFEVMIATAVASISIVALLELFSGTARLVGIAGAQTDAMVVARSVMDATLWQPDLDQADQLSGEHGSYRWRIEIFDFESQLGLIEGERREQELEPLQEDYELKEIVVTVTWDSAAGEQSVVLESARVMEAF
jgi:prepilin-type N-terminal cleavage/methylation domain-containing protein